MNRFRECRIAAGLRQYDAAEKLGIAHPSMSNWERGKTHPTLENVKAMSALYNVSVDYLLGDVDEKIPNRRSITTDDIRIALIGENGQMNETQLAEIKRFARYLCRVEQ